MQLWRWGDGRREAWLAAAAAPLVALTIGLFLTLAPPAAVQSPVFDSARMWIPLRLWGALFLIKAAVAAVTFVRRSWLGLYWAMILGLAIYIVWAILSVYTAATAHWAGTIGAALWGWAAFSHWLCRRVFLREYRIDLAR